MVALGLRLAVLLRHCVDWFGFGFPSYGGRCFLVWLLAAGDGWWVC